jgi:hypothetical protein
MKVLDEIRELIQYDDSLLFPINKEIKSIIWKIRGELVYREKRCIEKGISREEFEEFWKEFNSEDEPSNKFIELYEKIYEKKF